MKQLNLLDSHKEETIKEFIEKAMLNAKREALQKNNGTRLKTWHVTDFVKACLRNTVYSKRPELKRGLTDELVNVLYQGQIVHENSKLGSINELSMCYDIINKIAIDPQDVKELPEEKIKNIITGTLDDLLKIGNDFVLCDKKTYNSKGYVKKEPNPEHVLQVQVYSLMLAASYSIYPKYGCIIYLDKANGLSTSQFVFEIDPIEKTQIFLEQTLLTLQGLLPDPTVTFLCNGKNRAGKIYCPYIDQCKKDGGGGPN